MCIVCVDICWVVFMLVDFCMQVGLFVEVFDLCYWLQCWIDVVVLCLCEYDSGCYCYGYVQVSGLLLELVWFLYVDGDYVIVCIMMECFL